MPNMNKTAAFSWFMLGFGVASIMLAISIDLWLPKEKIQLNRERYIIL
jgi:hypothetical protein